MEIKPYIVERVRRQPSVPSVIPGSTPVLAFGNPLTAVVATVGLNPSRVEFLTDGDELLGGTRRRLATLASLGVSRPTLAGDDLLRAVVRDCATYFERNPYRRWFDQLEPMLHAVGASYYDSTACHLDLVQWATNPTWSSLPSSERRVLLQEDVPFLIAQLENERIRTVLLNGRGVIRQFERYVGTTLTLADSIVEDGHQATHVYLGKMFGRVRVVGWSTNLQSSFGVTRERRTRLATFLRQLVLSDTAT